MKTRSCTVFLKAKPQVSEIESYKGQGRRKVRCTMA